MKPDPKNHTHIQFDVRIVVAILLVIIAAMLIMWKPWSSDSTRTIEVTGEALVSATPDEFIFSPTYQFENANKDAALAAVQQKSQEAVTALKNLGVPEAGIKTNASAYETMIYREQPDGPPTYTLQLTITAGSQELAQKVQDYLLTTSPVGAISPQPTFSETKRKELEATARDQAAKEARSKAEQMGKDLGFNIGKVKSVQDGGGFSIMPVGRADITLESSLIKPNLSIQPGENQLPYSVKVVYYIR